MCLHLRSAICQPADLLGVKSPYTAIINQLQQSKIHDKDISVHLSSLNYLLPDLMVPAGDLAYSRATRSGFEEEASPLRHITLKVNSKPSIASSYMHLPSHPLPPTPSPSLAFLRSTSSFSSLILFLFPPPSSFQFLHLGSCNFFLSSSVIPQPHHPLLLFVFSIPPLVEALFC